MLDRQGRPVEDLVAVHVGERHFRCRGQPQVTVGNAEGVAGKLWQVAGPGHGIAIDQERWLHLDVSVPFCVGVEHVLNKGSLQPRPLAYHEGEAGAGDLGTSLAVQDAKLFADLKVRLDLEAEVGLLAPRAQLQVAGLVRAHRYRLVVDVRYLQGQEVELALDLPELLLVLVNLPFELSCPLQDLGRGWRDDPRPRTGPGDAGTDRFVE